MTTKRNKTKRGSIYWFVPQFSVAVVEDSMQVPEFDIARWSGYTRSEIGDEYVWRLYRNENSLDIRPAPLSKNFCPRLVVKMDGTNYHEWSPPDERLLRDLKALYRLIQKSVRPESDPAVREKILEMARTYTSYATYYPADGSHIGLTTHS